MTTKPRIMVIDDDLGVCESLKLALWKDYDVHVAHDGPSGLAALHATPADAVLVDCVLPGPLLGDAVCELIHNEWPSLPTILVSGLLDTWMLQDVAERRVADAYFPKPFDVFELRKRLAELTGGSPSSSS